MYYLPLAISRKNFLQYFVKSNKLLVGTHLATRARRGSDIENIVW